MGAEADLSTKIRIFALNGCDILKIKSFGRKYASFGGVDYNRLKLCELDRNVALTAFHY